jgi:exopolysaccharide biosynthesis polyprenyl glycosylphosphotransferase
MLRRQAGHRFGHDLSSAVGLLLLDIVSWAGIYAFATYVRGDGFYTTPLQFVFIEALQLAVLVGALFVIGGYSHTTEMRGLSYSTEHVLAVCGAALASAAVLYSAATFDQTMKPSRSALLLSFVAFLPLSLGYRRAVRTVVAAATSARAFLVVGSGELAREFYRAYKRSVNRERLEFVDPEREHVGEHISGPGSPVIEGDLATKLERLGTGYSGVILAERIDRVRPELLEQLVRTQFHQTRVYTLESFHEVHWRYVPVHSLDPFWPLQRGFQLARNSPYHFAKRLFDLAFSAVLLVICAPLLALIALAVRCDSGSPILFTQTRIGRDDERFTVFKFRTMRARQDGAREKSEVGGQNAEGNVMTAEHSAVRHLNSETFDDMYTRRNDPRITPVGRWLRKLRLDELPQIWNVFRGEMSLIGPRAEWDRCAERYAKVIPFYHFRHLVKPGITGWAQVNYPYGESDADAIEKLKYDLYYIRNYSLKLDLMIVFKTVYTVLVGKGQ